jgi:hypothetical protein
VASVIWIDTDIQCLVTLTMPAIEIAKRGAFELTKRENFASREPGVIVVFCVLGAIGILLIALYCAKKMKQRKDRQQI